MSMFQPILPCRYLFLSVSGPHGNQPPGDSHHYQRPPPQLHEISRGSKLGEGGCPQIHSQPHMLPLARGRPAAVCITEG